MAYLLRSLIMRFWNSDEMPLLKLGRDSSLSVCLSCTLSVWWLGCLWRCGLRKAILMSFRRRGKGPSLIMASCSSEKKETEFCCGLKKKYIFLSCLPPPPKLITGLAWLNFESLYGKVIKNTANYKQWMIDKNSSGDRNLREILCKKMTSLKTKSKGTKKG